jgi:hypothetical protein
MPTPALRLSVFLVLAGGFAVACAPSANVARHAISGGGAQVAVGNLTSGLKAAPPAVCAAMAGIFLLPTSVDPSMVITSLAGERAPALLGQLTPEITPAVGFEWTQAENAAVRDLPADFGPRDASPLVSAFPTRVDQLTETANTFATVDDAVRWFASWPGVSALSPEDLEPGAIRDAIPAVATLTQADEAEVTDWTRPGFDMPTDIQYVMTAGSTVITLELTGGEQVTEASTEAYARAALDLVVLTCSGLLGA